MKQVNKSLVLTTSAILFSAFSFTALADTVSQTYQVEPGETLYLKTDAGSINVETHNSDSVDIEVEIEGPDADEFTVRFEQTSDGVNIYGDKEHEGGWGWGNQLRVKYHLHVPENYNLDLNTAGGSIKVEDLNGNIEAQTSGGSIGLGDIVGNVDVHTSGGSIRVESVYGEIDANTSGGSIKVEFAKQITEDANLSTSGGSITAWLPDDIAIDLSASTSGGSVKTDFDVDGRVKKRSIRGEINGGGPELTLRTSGGSVKIKKQ